MPSCILLSSRPPWFAPRAPRASIAVTAESLDVIEDDKDLFGTCLTFEEIQDATGNFDTRNAISEYGPSVVSGIHPVFGGIAVSTFLKSDSKGMLRLSEKDKWAHKNVATPIAYCSDKELHVVYDFKYMCSLKEMLLKDELDTRERLKIAVDIASALSHISRIESPLQLSNLSTEKIWLRKNGTAVLADFCGSSCGGTTVLMEDFGKLLREVMPSALLPVGTLADRCCNGTDSEGDVSFEEVINVLEGVLASDVISSYI